VNADYFISAGEGPARVRIQLKLNYNDLDGNGTFDPGIDRPAGVSVMMLDEPAWKL
jgi:hypothetical protein